MADFNSFDLNRGSQQHPPEQKLHHHDTAYYLVATTLSVVVFGLIVCVLFEGYYITQSAAGILGFQIAALSILVPIIFWASHLKGSAYVRATCAGLIKFLLWAYVLVLIRMALSIPMFAIYASWSNFPNPGFFLDLGLWLYVILTLRAGMHQASSGAQFRPHSIQRSKVAQRQPAVPHPVDALPLNTLGNFLPNLGEDFSTGLPTSASHGISAIKNPRTAPRISKLAVVGLSAALLLAVSTFSTYKFLGKAWHTNKILSHLHKTPLTTSELTPGAEFNLVDGLKGESGQVARWNSCEPIRVVLNLQNAVPETVTITKIALKNVEQATGLSIEILGETDETYSNNRKPFQPEIYSSQGDAWAPVLLDWRTTEDFRASLPEHSGDVVGWAGPLFETQGQTSQIVTGAGQFDATWFKDQISQGNVTDPTSVVMHEFGHIMGLDHVDNKREIMNPVENGFTNWGPGDRAGLAYLGAGPCLTSEQKIKPGY